MDGTARKSPIRPAAFAWVPLVIVHAVAFVGATLVVAHQARADAVGKRQPAGAPVGGSQRRDARAGVYGRRTLQYKDESMRDDIADFFVAALLGGAVGDALGGIRKAGTETDDTQQALVVVESILDRGGIDPTDVARRLLEMWRRGKRYGYDPAFQQTMERLDAGVPRAAAASVDLPSSSAVMRMGPVGLWHWQQGEEIRQDAMALCHVTHRDARAVAAAVAVAHVVGHLMTHRPMDVEEVIEVAEWSARPVDEATGEMIGQLRALLEMPAPAACRALLEMPGEAPVTAAVALEAFLRTPGDFEATVRRALETGGDVGTFAAVAGTLSGTYNGMLPGHLVDGLPEGARIQGLGEALYRKTVEGTALEGE